MTNAVSCCRFGLSSSARTVPLLADRILYFPDSERRELMYVSLCLVILNVEKSFSLMITSLYFPCAIGQRCEAVFCPQNRYSTVMRCDLVLSFSDRYTFMERFVSWMTVWLSSVVQILTSDHKEATEIRSWQP